MRIKSFIVLVSLILFFCNEEEQREKHSFSGQVFEKLDDGSTEPLKEAKIKLRFYDMVAPLIYYPIETVDLVTDSEGKYLFAKQIDDIDSYDVFSVSVDEEYLKNCGSFYDDVMTVEYISIEGLDNTVNVDACKISVVKIAANEINESSNNTLTISRSWESGSINFTTILGILSSDREILLYYPTSLTSIDLKFSIRNGNNATTSETKQINLVPMATTEVAVDF